MTFELSTLLHLCHLLDGGKLKLAVPLLQLPVGSNQLEITRIRIVLSLGTAGELESTFPTMNAARRVVRSSSDAAVSSEIG